MNKWSELLGGNESPQMPSKPDGQKSFFNINIAIFAVIAVILAFVLVSTNSSRSKTRNSREIEVHELDNSVVLKAVARKDDDAGAGAAGAVGAVGAVESAEAIVQAKFTVEDPLWTYTSEEPDMEGYSFSDFQRALLYGREASEGRLEIGPSDEPDIKPRVYASSMETISEESQMLVREAFQFIPTDNAGSATVILRDILAARTEANSFGITMPEAPEDHMSALKYWASTSGNASTIAKTILSRL